MNDHLIGAGKERIQSLPSFDKKTASKTAALSEAEKLALVEEDGSASNSHKLNLSGTHYLHDDDMLTVLFLDI